MSTKQHLDILNALAADLEFVAVNLRKDDLAFIARIIEEAKNKVDRAATWLALRKEIPE